MAYSLNGSNFTVAQDQDSEEVGNGVGRRISPTSVRMLQIRSSSTFTPDTEENVEAQTEEIFLNYVYQSYRNDSVHRDVDSTFAAPELLLFSASPVTPVAEIGRHLARLGDDLNDKYADMFDGMISSLNLAMDAESSYEAFSNIGRRVFASGTNWGRIMILLSFGYRMAVTMLRNQAANFASFLRKIVSFICRFVVTERIAKWIADHGGWRAALNYVPSASSSTFFLVSGLAAVSVLAVFAWNRFLQ